MKTKHKVRVVFLFALIIYLIYGIVKTLALDFPQDFASTAPIVGSIALILESLWLIYYQVRGC